MAEDLIMYKRIERWSNRPGVVAIATLLVKDDSHGIYEVDIKTKGEAIKITLDLIKMYKLWSNYYEWIVIDAPREIRELLWDSSNREWLPEPTDISDYSSWNKEIISLALEHEEIIMCDYPGRAVKNTLKLIKQEIVYFERVLNEFMNL